jgi:coproporphyrinogen dehydrogenase HemZ
MIQVLIKGHDYNYDTEELLKAIFPNNPISFVTEQALEKNGGLLIINSLETSLKEIKVTAQLYDKSQLMGSVSLTEEVEGDLHLLKRHQKKLIKLSLLKVAQDVFNIEMPWGILVGVRPVKLVHQYRNKGYDFSKISSILTNQYLIREDKIKLMIDIASVEEKYLINQDKDLISLYIGVPFCPTRCVYCSFTSNPMDKWGHLMSDYVKSLRSEINQVLDFVLNKGKKIQTIYIGGGTPTTLSAEHIQDILMDVMAYTDSSIREVTLEAGRPDTITYDKLRSAKDNGVTRISINPQTMNDCTLKHIGRSHSAKDIEIAFEQARKINFYSINADIILGLPGEDLNMVRHTLSQIERLKPHNLTVHTMAVKRASRLREEYDSHPMTSEKVVNRMLEETQSFAQDIGMIPYYMYRQKYMVGNLENIGYALPQKECIYNIQIIEENHTIIGFGPGAISKVFYPMEDRLERVENVKNLEHYINRTDEMINRKKTELEKLL